jgi:hypothetical protein
MKKLIVALSFALFTTGAFAFSPSEKFTPTEKVLKAFTETFSGAEEVKWEEYSTYFTVSFINSGIRSKVNYDKEGNMLGSIRYYNPELLPLNILAKIKKENAKKSLFGVTEVTLGNEVTYYIKLEDAKTWTTLKVDASGNSVVFEKYKKA